MTADQTRYALYFTAPPRSSLDRIGSAMIGYDAYSGSPVEHPKLVGVDPRSLEALTAEPRRYGFHATLKAPFRLRQPLRPDALLDELRTFAECHPPVPIDRLTIAEMGSFLALVPDGARRELDLFAAEIVAAFDGFRAPLSEAELERRTAGKLSPRHQALLDRWGYPYVFDQFRFHMTLTGSLPDGERARWRAALHGLVADLEPVVLDAVSLLQQEHPMSRFEVIDRISLTGTP